MKKSQVNVNGALYGNVAECLAANDFNIGYLRPWLGNDGFTYVRNNEGKAVRIANATSTLRKDDWIQLDQAIVKAAKPRLKLVNSLRASGLRYQIQNGLGTTVLQTETMGDINDAGVSMDALVATNSDRPEFELSNLPLPVISKDFHFSLRQINTSRRGGSPLDTTMAEECARKVAEIAEKMALGTYGSYTFGGGTVYGLTNFPSSLLKTMTSPAVSAWTPETTVTEVLAMRQQAYDAHQYGPFKLYVSPAWDAKLDADFKANGDRTLRERIEKIANIEEVVTLDYLTGYKMILVQQTSTTIRIVEGMDITTLQWDSDGGLKKNFKVMAILVPQIRADQNSKCGIVYGSV